MRQPSVMLSIALVLGAASAARADIIELNPNQAANWQGALSGYVRGTAPQQYIRGRIRNRGGPRGFIVTPFVGTSWAPDSAQVSVLWRWVGRIRHEIDTDVDLQNLVSNRRQLFATPDDAMRDLLVKIDGGAGLGITDGAPGAQVPGAPPLIQGSLERYFVLGPISTPTLRAQLKAQVDAAAANRDYFYSLLSDRQPEDVMTALVEGHARAVKFGTNELPDPVTGDTFPERIRRVANLLTEQLSKVPPNAAPPSPLDAPTPQARGFRVRQYALRMRSALVNLVGGGAPETKSLPFGGQNDAEMPLTNEDVASSAIDFVATMVPTPDGLDYTTQGLVTPREEAGRLVEALIRVAAGSGPNTSKAMNALATLVDESVPWPYASAADLPAHDADGRPVDATYRGRLTSHVDDPDPARARAAQQSMLAAGLGSDAQVRQAVEDLFRVAIPATPPAPRSLEDQRRSDAIWTLLRLSHAANDAKTKSLAHSLVAARVQQIVAKERAGVIGDAEKSFLKSLRNPRRH